MADLMFARTLAVIAALWLPAQGVVTASEMLCQTSMASDAARESSVSGYCQYAQGARVPGGACHVCAACGQCPSPVIGNGVVRDRSLSDRSLARLSAGNLPSFITAPLKHPPRSLLALV